MSEKEVSSRNFRFSVEIYSNKYYNFTVTGGNYEYKSGGDGKWVPVLLEYFTINR